MAKINEGSFRNWNDGETVKASDYKQEREIIRVAVNDTHDRFLIEQSQNQQSRLIIEENVPKIEAFETTAADVEAKGNYALAQGDYAKGQGNAIQEALEKSVNILKQPETPSGIVEGRLWLDTSDNAYQGTVFNELSTQLAHTTTDIEERGVNVKALGAKGDKSTDDTFIIQQALNNYSKVYFPKGDYVISDTIQIPANRVIEGENKDTSVIVWTLNNQDQKTMFYVNQNSDNQSSIIRNLGFNQKRQERNLSDDMVSSAIIPVTNVLIEKVKIENTIGPGITSSRCKNITVRECDILNTGHHNIYFSTGSTNGILENILIENNFLDDPADLSIRNHPANIIKFRFGTAGDVIKNVKILNNVMGVSKGTELYDVFISTTSGGVSLLENFELIGNIINHQKQAVEGAHIVLYIGANSKGDNVKIKDNKIVNGSTHTSSYGMRLLFSDLPNTKNVVVEGNTIESTYYGIDSRKTAILNNDIQFIFRGIFCIEGRAHGNVLKSTNDNAQGIYRSDIDITDNFIDLTGATTIGIETPHITGRQVLNNHIRNVTEGIKQGQSNVINCVINGNRFVNVGTKYVGFTSATHLNSLVEPSYKDRRGLTADRPSNPEIGERYYDVSLSKPIWWNGSSWKDATGATV